MIDEVCVYYYKGCNLELFGLLSEVLVCYKLSVRLCNKIRVSFWFWKENFFIDEWKINLFDEFYFVNIVLCRIMLKFDFVLEVFWVVE